jgi:hypothetical protein
MAEVIGSEYGIGIGARQDRSAQGTDVMRPTSAQAVGTPSRLVSALLATVVMLGIGVDGATAKEPPAPPVLERIISKSDTTLEVQWSGLNREKASVDGIVAQLYDYDGSHLETRDIPPLVGTGVKKADLKDLQPLTKYCVALQSWQASDEEGVEPLYSELSERKCASTQASPAPDLSLRNIRGREEREWKQVQNQAPAYLVEVRNSGGDAVGTVVVDISTSGVATLAEQPVVVRQGWEANGFTCKVRPASGGETAGLRCTGGTLKEGQTITPAVAVRFTRAGYGYIHASVSVSGGEPEEETSNNGLALPVRIY